MTPVVLLSDLRRREILVSLDGDQLRVNAPRGSLSDELRTALREQKPELIALLRREQAEAPSPVDVDALPPERAAILELARRKGFPGLYYCGRLAGSGRRTWERFSRTAHPTWLPLAEAALRDYTPGSMPRGIAAEEGR